jgi:ribosomal protein S18 acetylase RimI-like enzyme
MTHWVRPLRPEEHARARRTLAASFENDPLYRFLLPERSRARWLEVLMAAALADTAPEGHVYAHGDGPDAGVMALVPPGRWPTPSRRSLGFAVKRWRRPSMPLPSMRLLRAGPAVLRAMEDVHLDRPHYYLQVIGVDPTQAGKGIGGALVGFAAHLADRDAVPLYLETSNHTNLSFYRRYGFDVICELETPGGGPPIWTMLRPVRPLRGR